MIKLNCTSCGAEVQFRSKASVFAVCSFCKSTLVRQDMNLELLGKMADLQFDMSPIQLGTSGKYEGKSFDVIGRLKVDYPDGFWNEWYTIFNDGQTGWLAEAQGFLAICFSRNDIKIPEVLNLHAGVEVPFDDKLFRVEEKRKVTCSYSEGELPVNAVRGRESVSVDFATEHGDMATIEYAKDETRAFIGRYLDFDKFEFSSLRRIDGW